MLGEKKYDSSKHLREVTATTSGGNSSDVTHAQNVLRKMRKVLPFPTTFKVLMYRFVSYTQHDLCQYSVTSRP